ncbi:hypothetical protein P4657_04560, partial [Halalkalibacterium halodurans]
MSKSTIDLKQLSIQSSFPNSQKRYVTGSRSDIRVPFREISQHPTVTDSGE